MKILSDKGYIEPIKEIPSFDSDSYFKIIFNDNLGYILATNDHFWNVIIDNHEEIETTEYLYNNFFSLKSKKGLKLDIPESNCEYFIKKIKKINGKKKKFFCYEIDTPKKQFMIYPKRNLLQEYIANKKFKDDIDLFEVKRAGVFIHNCQCRIGCGRLQGMSSMMLFGNTIGTSVDGSRQGSGIMASNGVMYNIQYFYEEIEWLKKWYKKCGFDKQGYCIHGSYPENKVSKTEEDRETNLTTDDLDAIFDFKPEVAVFEYDQELRKEVNRTQKQNFE